MGVEEVVESLGGVIINVGRPVRTVAQAVKATGVSPRQVIKSLVLISEKGPILAIVDGESRVSLEKVRQHFGGVRLATPEEVREITGFEVGGVPPVGINIKTIVDPRVLENEFVIGGGGRIDKLCKLNPRKIVEHQKAEIIEIRE
ncbi:hypothetical protein DRN82_07705 [Thermococci archaeon]|nr:MAG: hypothetical protein DRN82_07705 [Thermococci archaeon]